MKSAKTVFACDIGGSKLLCGLVQEDGTILDTERRPLSPTLTTEELESFLVQAFERLCERNPKHVPFACGMTIPGVADPASGMWTYACFSGIADYPIARRMEERLSLPVRIENDVNACAWAERIWGNGRDGEDFLWITVSNGVGGGLVLNGKLYEGMAGGAGEFGHLIIAQDGAVCPCGHRGCMEAMAAGPAISRRYAALTGEHHSAAEIAALARSGNQTALDVIRETGSYVGTGLGKVASILNLKRYILGGGVMQSFDLMEESIWEAFRTQAFERPNQAVQIVTTALQYEAGLLGAAAIVLDPPHEKGEQI